MFSMNLWFGVAYHPALFNMDNGDIGVIRSHILCFRYLIVFLKNMFYNIKNREIDTIVCFF